jgi:selenium metabolism protein YedF
MTSKCNGSNKAKGLFIVITSDVMGRDESIGQVLMKGFFETMKSMQSLPHTIFFMNAAVKMTTIDDEFVSLLKGIQDAGVEIYSCGKCLKHYSVEDRLRVGHRGSTGQVIEGISDAGVIWI